MWIIIYICLAIISFCFYYKQNKDVLHPCSVMLTIWFLGCASSNIKVGNMLLNQWSLEMHFVCILSSLSIMIGSLPFIIKKKVKLNELYPVSKTFTNILYILFFISSICFLFEWKLNNFEISILKDFAESGDLKSGKVGIPFVHYGTLLLPFLAILAYFKIINDRHYFSFASFILLFVIIIFCFMANISRGDLLICFLGILFIYSRYYKLNLKKIGIISICLFLILVGVALLRIQNETSVVYTSSTNRYISVIYSYIVTCYANLNDYINGGYPYHPLGNITFSSLWTLSGNVDVLPKTLIEQMYVFNARTYLYGFYHDFKIFGVILFPLIIGASLSYLYKLSLIGSRHWNLLLAAMQKAIVVCFFGNYFFGELVFIFPYLIVLLFILLVKKYKITFTK